MPMLLGITSDIHANLPALETVLDHMKTVGVEKKICLGDLVGYCASPNECVELVMNNFNYIVKGNHDEACEDTFLAIGFNPIARETIEWTATQLTETNKDVLKNLSYGHILELDFGNVMLVHGNPKDHFLYVSDLPEASDAFVNSLEPFEIAFIGHTHVPIVWAKDDNTTVYVKPSFNGSSGIEKFSLVLNVPKTKYIINVGSIGQPRDSDPRLCYATFNTESHELTFYRLPYSVDRTIALMQREQFGFDAWQRFLYGV